jgi:hypothetical protein
MPEFSTDLRLVAEGTSFAIASASNTPALASEQQYQQTYEGEKA